nr:rho GTPase-activating protein 10-like isoform X1 [Lepeophtheirus salmonis]
MMGLLPLEFTECLQDSPFFRDSLHSHEKELERTSQNIKDLIKEVKNLIHAAKALSACQRKLSQLLRDFKFECIGNNQTDDEIIIAGSLKEFGNLIAAIEDEKDRMLERAFEQFIEPLENFRKDQIGSVKERKKKFEKQTAKFCTSQERYLSLSTKKNDSTLQEADAILGMEQRDFNRAGLEYVSLIQEVQEKKKFEFVETLLGFMYGWLTFYHQGHEVATDFKPHMMELQSRIQKVTPIKKSIVALCQSDDHFQTRENFNSSREDIQALMRKILDKPLDSGTLNKMFTRSGYLYVMEKKALTTVWNKCFCRYQREGRIFCMIPYSQMTGKMVSTDSFRLKSCVRRIPDSIDKRFCFDITGEDRPSTVYTMQAQSEDDLRLWLEALDGTEPMYVLPPKPSNADHSYLDEGGFNFITRSFSVLENRGLEDQGLYRVVGVSSKVTKLLTMGLDKRKSEKLNLDDPMEWESKTITSAIKTFFRNLSEPIMTFQLHHQFIAAAKLETREERISEVNRLVLQIPEPNKRMLELLCQHLEKVAGNSKKNMMTVSNLGVCFGPTLLRAEEETVAAIMDIKFGNVVVEILIENWKQFLSNEQTQQPESSSASSQKDLKGNNSGSLTVLPLGANIPSPRIMSPHRPPPPYHPPPPPLGVATLAHAVIYNNGPKQVQITNRSPPQDTSSYQSATWERTLRVSSQTNLVPVPAGSAPHHTSSGLTGPPRTVHSSLSNLSNASASTAPLSSIMSSYDHQTYSTIKSTSSTNLKSVQRHSTTGGAIQALGLSSAAALSSSGQVSLSRPAQICSSSSSSMESLHSTSSMKEMASKISAQKSSPNCKHFRLRPHPPSRISNSHLQIARHLNRLTPTMEIRKVRTLYACVGEREPELSFEPNQIITSIRPSFEPGWLEGCLDGKVGLVPENYVEYIS